MNNKHTQVHSALIGLAIGDALGVPVEFKSRDALTKDPVTKMMGNMCWNQPLGTWSDDSSLTFCLAESLCKGYDLEDIGKNFVKWMSVGYWGAHNKVFDIGGSTRYSLRRIQNGESAKFSGNMMIEDNGNGSLMRILPLAFHLSKETDLSQLYNTVREVSSITHAHFRSVFSCFIYILIAIELLNQKSKEMAYEAMQIKVKEFAIKNEFNSNETRLFSRILNNRITDFEKETIHSTGYVLHSLEASLWCILKHNNYSDTVLEAVNLGGDTDTIAAITGGIAGIIYGMEGIPNEWLKQLVKMNEIDDLCNRFAIKYNL